VARWLPGFRRGVSFFGLAILVLMLFGSEWFYRNWYRNWFSGTGIDFYGGQWLLAALIFFPAAWWMSKPASFIPRNPARSRKWLIILTVAQVVFAVTRIYFQITSWQRAFAWNVLSITVTALLAPAFDIEIWLLLNLFIRPLGLVPNSLPRALLRGVQVLLLYSLLCPDIIFGMAEFASLYYMKNHIAIAPGASYFPSSWVKPLTVISLPAQHLRAVIWWVLLLVILHCRYRLHGRVLSRSTTV
jgi:hypothetical protein